MDNVSILVDMGFAEDRALYALKVTNNQGVETAMEWLLAHCDEEIPVTQAVSNRGNAVNDGSSPAPAADTSSTAADKTSSDEATVGASTTANTSTEAANALARSLKCDNCGKLFTSSDMLDYHALKTGHVNFSESSEEKPPLTEEERKQQLALLEERLKAKRIEREEREKRDALERERNRIRAGKDMTEARKRMEEMEMKKLVEQRKREKAEEKAARERVRAQIEADKAARKARNGGNSATSPQSDDDKPIIAAASTTSPMAGGIGTAASSSGVSGRKEYKETRIQIRLQDGSTLVETFNVKEQLSAVRVFIQVKTGADLPFTLMTTFPRKVFSDEDYEKPLEVLGLVPSAVLTMAKAVEA